MSATAQARNALPEVVMARHRWSVADYYRLAEAGVLGEDSRVELIAGEIIDMAPIGSMHAHMLNRLTRALYRVLGERFVIRVQDPIQLDDHNEPQPDLVVARDRDYSAGHPRPEDILLVVEVADTTLAYDRDVKLPLYGRSGIPQAWLLDTGKKRLTVYRDPADGSYRQENTPGAGERLMIGDVDIAVEDLL